MTSSNSKTSPERKRNKSSETISQHSPLSSSQGRLSINHGDSSQPAVAQNAVTSHAPNNTVIESVVSPCEKRYMYSSARNDQETRPVTRIEKPTDVPEVTPIQVFIKKIIDQQLAPEENSGLVASNGKKKKQKNKENSSQNSGARVRSTPRRKESYRNDKTINSNALRKTKRNPPSQNKEKSACQLGNRKGPTNNGKSSEIDAISKKSTTLNIIEKELITKSNNSNNRTFNLSKPPKQDSLKITLKSPKSTFTANHNLDGKFNSRISRPRDQYMRRTAARVRNLAQIGAFLRTHIFTAISKSQAHKKRIVEDRILKSPIGDERLPGHMNHQNLPLTASQDLSSTGGPQNPIQNNRSDIAPLPVTSNSGPGGTVITEIPSEPPKQACTKSILNPHQIKEYHSSQKSKHAKKQIHPRDKNIGKHKNKVLKSRKNGRSISSIGKLTSVLESKLKSKTHHTKQLVPDSRSDHGDIDEISPSSLEQWSAPMKVDVPIERPSTKDVNLAIKSSKEYYSPSCRNHLDVDANEQNNFSTLHTPAHTEMQAKNGSQSQVRNEASMKSLPTSQNEGGNPGSSNQHQEAATNSTRSQVPAMKSIELIPQLDFRKSSKSGRYWQVGQEENPQVGQKSIPGTRPIITNKSLVLYKSAHPNTPKNQMKIPEIPANMERDSPRAESHTSQAEAQNKTINGSRRRASVVQDRKKSIHIEKDTDKLMNQKKRQPSNSDSPTNHPRNEIQPSKKRRISKREMKMLENSNQTIEGSRKRVPLRNALEYNNTCAEVEDHELSSENVASPIPNRRNTGFIVPTCGEHSEQTHREKGGEHSHGNKSNRKNLRSLALDQQEQKDTSPFSPSQPQGHVQGINGQDQPPIHSTDLPVTRNQNFTHNPVQTMDNFPDLFNSQQPGAHPGSLQHLTTGISIAGNLQDNERIPITRNITPRLPPDPALGEKSQYHSSVIDTFQNLLSLAQKLYGRSSINPSQMFDSIRHGKDPSLHQEPHPLKQSAQKSDNFSFTEGRELSSSPNEGNTFLNNCEQNNQAQRGPNYDGRPTGNSTNWNLPISGFGNNSGRIQGGRNLSPRNNFDYEPREKAAYGTRAESHNIQMGQSQEIQRKITPNRHKYSSRRKNMADTYQVDLLSVNRKTSITQRESKNASRIPSKISLSSKQQSPRKDVDVVILPNGRQNANDSYSTSIKRTYNGENDEIYQVLPFSNRGGSQSGRSLRFKKSLEKNREDPLTVVAEFITLTVILENFLNSCETEPEIVDGWHIQRLREILYFSNIAHKCFGRISNARTHLCNVEYNSKLTKHWLCSKQNTNTAFLFREMGQKIIGSNYKHSNKLDQDVAIIQAVSRGIQKLYKELSDMNTMLISMPQWFHMLMEQVLADVFFN